MGPDTLFTYFFYISFPNSSNPHFIIITCLLLPLPIQHLPITGWLLVVLLLHVSSLSPLPNLMSYINLLYEWIFSKTFYVKAPRM